jgi:hypothetical protein
MKKYKNDIFNSIFNDIRNSDVVYALTLQSDSEKTDRIAFEGKVKQLIYWLNEYCYGSQFSKNNRELKVIGGFEIGLFKGKPHCHLVISHNSDMKRSISELECFISKKWYRLFNKNRNFMSGLVDFTYVNHIDKAFNYALKKVDNRNFDSLLWL